MDSGHGTSGTVSASFCRNSCSQMCGAGTCGEHGVREGHDRCHMFNRGLYSCPHKVGPSYGEAKVLEILVEVPKSERRSQALAHHMHKKGVDCHSCYFASRVIRHVCGRPFMVMACDRHQALGQTRLTRSVNDTRDLQLINWRASIQPTKPRCGRWWPPIRPV